MEEGIFYIQNITLKGENRKMIQSVAIVHSELQQGVYRFLADFFRFVGILVYNYAVIDDENHKDIEINYVFDTVFIDKTPSRAVEVGLSENQINLVKNHISSPKMVDVSGENLRWGGSESDKTIRKEYLSNTIISKLGVNNNEKMALKFLAEIYVDESVMRHRVILHTFLHFPKMIQETRTNLVDAYIKLLNKQQFEVFKDVEYYWFAQRYLEHLINEACDFLKTDYIFDTKSIVSKIDLEASKKEESHRLYYRYLKELAASFYECDRWLRGESVKYYKEAAESAKDTPFESYMRYCHGRAIEKYEHDWRKAINQYNMAKGLQNDEYRTEYKLAVYEWKERLNLADAYVHFKRIDEILNNKRNHNVLQPLEAEYLYKAWHFINILFEESNADDHAAKLNVSGLTSSKIQTELEGIVRIVRDDDYKNPIYNYIFGDSKQGEAYYREMLARRITEVCDLGRTSV